MTAGRRGAARPEMLMERRLMPPRGLRAQNACSEWWGVAASPRGLLASRVQGVNTVVAPERF